MSVTCQIWTAIFAIIAKSTLRSLCYRSFVSLKNQRSAQQFEQLKFFFWLFHFVTGTVALPDRSRVAAYRFSLPLPLLRISPKRLVARRCASSATCAYRHVVCGCV
jgi:hypothetical protein